MGGWPGVCYFLRESWQLAWGREAEGEGRPRVMSTAGGLQQWQIGAVEQAAEGWSWSAPNEVPLRQWWRTSSYQAIYQVSAGSVPVMDACPSHAPSCRPSWSLASVVAVVMSLLLLLVQANGQSPCTSTTTRTY